MTHHTLQFVPVGRGFLILYPDHLNDEFKATFLESWQARFTGVPAMLFEYARLVHLGDGTPMFEFSGENLTPALLDEFRAWWEQQTKEG